jgi:hypothetical protein
MISSSGPCVLHVTPFDPHFHLTSTLGVPLSANMLWHTLARRFTLLRSEEGEFVGLDHLRARLAEQSSRGAPNQVSEEEENMILEALGRMRVRVAAAEQRDDLLSDSGLPTSISYQLSRHFY